MGIDIHSSYRTQIYSCITVSGVAEGVGGGLDYCNSNGGPAPGCKQSKAFIIFLLGSMLPHHMPSSLWSDHVSGFEKKFR